MTENSFFIVSCARSGSTSLAQILNSAKNCTCVSEPTPNLNVETRLMMDGRINDPHTILKETIVKRVARAKAEIYGEKNVTYGPFIPHLHEMLNCKFIFLKRDGRDVVRSLMDWHNKVFGTIYRECRDLGNLSPRALESAANLPIHLDTSDYSRPRPTMGTPISHMWEQLSREEMCAYYWAYINDLYLDQLGKIPGDAWTVIDYTDPEADAVAQVAAFLGLDRIPRRRIEKILEAKVNSLGNRFKEDKDYPDWRNWDGGQRRRFDAIAADTMHRLSYYSSERTRWKPARYGAIWQERSSDLEWYTWMYEARLGIHEQFIKWVRRNEPIKSIADFGCGLGVGISEEFTDKRYVGVDLSPGSIKWCREHRGQPNHGYVAADFVEAPLDEEFDLVFSSGTIDNAYDVDAFLTAMVEASRRWIYLTCYKGWYPDHEEHKYKWDPGHGCFYNELSPRRIIETLLDLGCHSIRVEPAPTGRPDPMYETRVVARCGE